MTQKHLVDPSTLAEHKKKYPALRNKSYMNFGALGAMAESSMSAISSSFQHVQESGPFSGKTFAWITEETRAIKQILANAIGGKPESFALTQNATEGCNIVLWGLDWQEGDTLLTSDSEHNGVMNAVLQLCRRKKLSLQICKLAFLKSEEEILKELERGLESKPRLFMISHVLWNTGRVLPIKKMVELCHSKGVQVLVDGAQSAGVLPLNLTDINADYYAFTGHKWFCGPEGVAALHLSPASLDKVEPTFAGWRGAVFDSKGNPVGLAPDASRFEVATAPFPLLAGLADAIKVHNEIGSAGDRYELILANAKKLRQGIVNIPGLNLLDEQGGSSLVSFVIEGVSHGELVRRLEDKRFVLRTIPNPSCVRASVHYFSASEAEEFPEVLSRVLKEMA